MSFYHVYDELLSKKNIKDFILDLIDDYMDDEENIIVENNPFNETIVPTIALYKKKLIEKARSLIK